MSEKQKIVVPEGMLDAFMTALLKGLPDAEVKARYQRECWRKELAAALLWLSENPLVPTMGQLHAMEEKYDLLGLDGTGHGFCCEEWQRLMFLAPEPEEPEILEKIADLEDKLMPGYRPVYEQGPDGGWGAYVPELPGLGVASETREEVEVLIREGIRLHVEGLRKDGLPIPAPAV